MSFPSPVPVAVVATADTGKSDHLVVRYEE